MNQFELNPVLERDCLFAGDLALSRVLLMNNANFPWVILVPRKESASEFFDLKSSERDIFQKEISFVAENMKKLFSADKMNIAMLGNQVPQLHCHVIARFKGDFAWPNPVWGMDAKKYTDEQKEDVLAKLNALFVSKMVA